MNAIASYLTAAGWRESTMFVRSFTSGAIAITLWSARVFGPHTSSVLKADEWTLGEYRSPGVHSVVATGRTLEELKEALRRHVSTGTGEDGRVSKPRALDLFCGAGGATRGLQLAGFHVTGVDNRPQPRYVGDAFHQADAMTFPLEGFDFIWASPPCQAYSILRQRAGKHPKLIAPIRRRLVAAGVPFAIENVPGAPLKSPVVLCGAAFALRARCDDGRVRWLRRHRLIETSFGASGVACECRPGEKLGVYGLGQRRPIRPAPPQTPPLALFTRRLSG